MRGMRGGLVKVLLKGLQRSVHFLVAWTAARQAVNGSPCGALCPLSGPQEWRGGGAGTLSQAVKGPFGSWRFIDPNAAFQNNRKCSCNGPQLPLSASFSWHGPLHRVEPWASGRCSVCRRRSGWCVMTSFEAAPGWLILLRECSLCCADFKCARLQRDVRSNWAAWLISLPAASEKRGTDGRRHAPSVEEAG